MSQGKKPTVLLVEADASLRRLITLGLQQRGIHVLGISSSTSIPPLDVQHLDMVLLDVDHGTRSDWSLVEAERWNPHFTDVPTVVLSWECLIPGNLHTSTRPTTTTPAQVTCLTKPFDARILYATVEQLLAARAAREAAAISRAEEMLLVAYSAHTAPSIWPLITAAGVLLAFVGMMLQVAIAVAGILVVVVALLLWTLGAKPEQVMAVG